MASAEGQPSAAGGDDMTPLVALPPQAVSPTRVGITMAIRETKSQRLATTEWTTDSYDWPEGIDYDKWAPIARPAPAGAFADPLDFLDLPED